VFAKYADSQWRIGDSEISITWKTDVGSEGKASVQKSAGNEPSKLTAEKNVATWADFKSYATNLEPYRYLFRGQELNSWKLRTSFHRTGRASLLKFMTHDVSTLHRHLSGLTGHRFNLMDSLDYAAFLALVQHHGYPTPLLDWTRSP